MDNSFNSIIDSAEEILILLPTKAYFDQIAAGLSLYLALKSKKEVSIVAPFEMTVEHNRLVGVNKITKEIGSKNLIIKFLDYDAKKVERVSAEIDEGNNEFYLTVVPKPGNRAPKKDQVGFSYSGVSADTVILVGGANENHFPAFSQKKLVGAKLVHIGTRELGVSKDSGIMSFARPGSSTSEVVANILKDSSIDLDADMATNLLLGVEIATNKFSSREMTADTFELVATLMRKGGKRVVVENRDYPEGAIPTASSPHEEDKKAPKDWMEPKIFKGSTVS